MNRCKHCGTWRQRLFEGRCTKDGTETCLRRAAGRRPLDAWLHAKKFGTRRQ